MVFIIIMLLFSSLSFANFVVVWCHFFIACLISAKTRQWLTRWCYLIYFFFHRIMKIDIQRIIACLAIRHRLWGRQRPLKIKQSQQHQHHQQQRIVLRRHQSTVPLLHLGNLLIHQWREICIKPTPKYFN